MLLQWPEAWTVIKGEIKASLEYLIKNQHCLIYFRSISVITFWWLEDSL